MSNELGGDKESEPLTWGDTQSRIFCADAARSFTVDAILTHPLASTSPLSSAIPPRPPMPLPPPLLVVEDDPTIARALKRELNAHGFECILAQSAEQVREMNYSGLAIVDINLPDGNGLDLFEEMKREGRVMTAVFFSATRNPQECERAQRLGKFVPKSSGVSAAVSTALQIFHTSNPPRSTTRPSTPDCAASEDVVPAPPRARMRSGSDA